MYRKIYKLFVANQAISDSQTRIKIKKESDIHGLLMPPLHSPVVRLTCNQQVGDSNSSGGSIPSNNHHQATAEIITPSSDYDFKFEEDLIRSVI